MLKKVFKENLNVLKVNFSCSDLEAMGEVYGSFFTGKSGTWCHVLGWHIFCPV